jgi:hypothetical protein
MDDDLKRQLRAHFEACTAIFEAWGQCDYQHPPPACPPFPEECRGLTCDAKTLKGTPCKRTDLYENGRCPLHGGLSTGPRTAEGKQRSAANLPKPYGQVYQSVGTTRRKLVSRLCPGRVLWRGRTAGRWNSPPRRACAGWGGAVPLPPTRAKPICVWTHARHGL